MKTNLILPLSLALASSAFAQAVFYTDVNMNLPGSSNQTVDTVTPISISPDHTFVDSGNGTADVSATRYFGGTLTYTGGNVYGGSGRIFLTNPGAPNNTQIQLSLGGGASTWQFMGNQNTGVATASIDFVIKVEDNIYNLAVLKLYVGAGATSETEGAPLLTVTDGISDLNLSSMTFRLFGEGWETSAHTLTATNLFSSTEWTPVGASNIPEPSSFASLGGLAALGLAATRRRRRAM